MNSRLVCCAAVLGLFLSPVTAEICEITVWAMPEMQEVNIADGTAMVDLYAFIPEEFATIGFGFDVDVDGASVSYVGFAPAAPFIATPTFDGDGIGGVIFPPDTAFGDAVMLGTMTFSLDALGMSTLMFSDDNPDDLTEGFALEAVGAFAEMCYEGATITVIPEPAALALLALAGLMVRRR